METILIFSKVFTRCDGNGAHDEIFFPGYFRALCPLCAQISAAAEAAALADQNAENLASDADGREYEMERQRDIAEKELEALADDAAALVAAAKDALQLIETALEDGKDTDQAAALSVAIRQVENGSSGERRTR